MRAHIQFSIDGEVIGPIRTCDNVRLVVRELRKATPSDISRDAVPTYDDLLVLGRIYHTLFAECPDTLLLPICQADPADPSLLKLALLWAGPDDWEVFYRAEPEDYLAGSNIARWVLGVRQQPCALVVFCDPFPDTEVVLPRQVGLEARLALAVG